VFYGGHFYEADELEKWFVSSGNSSSPMTRKTHNADKTHLQTIPASQAVSLALELFKQTPQ
jgi:hypothetical protein